MIYINKKKTNQLVKAISVIFTIIVERGKQEKMIGLPQVMMYDMIGHYYLRKKNERYKWH